MKTAALLLALAIALPLYGQTRADESQVMETALDDVFGRSFSYVEEWVLGSKTENLAPAVDGTRFDAARKDYLARNTTRVPTGNMDVWDAVTIADLSRFGSAERFDWKRFGEDYPGDVWTARVSRPGFSDANHASIRVDVRHASAAKPLTVVVHLERAGDAWRVTGSETPAVVR